MEIPKFSKPPVTGPPDSDAALWAVLNAATKLFIAAETLADKIEDSPYTSYSDETDAVYEAGGKFVEAKVAALNAPAAVCDVAGVHDLVRMLADNSLADDPVWAARHVLKQWDEWKDVPNAPDWFKATK